MADEGTASEERGVQMLRKAVAIDPSLSEAHYQLGNLALSRGDASDAIEHLLTAFRNGDQSSKVHFALSRAYRAAGKMPESEKQAALFHERKQAEAKQ
jgi:predicted Zn-dependent protease